MMIFGGILWSVILNKNRSNSVQLHSRFPSNMYIIIILKHIIMIFQNKAYEIATIVLGLELREKH